jgi:hypothetical protein
MFSDPSTAGKYRRLGFLPEGLFLKLTLGNVTVCVGEHLFHGVALTLESFSSRSVCQYEVTLPEKCSIEQIAGLIYLNVAQNLRESKDAFRIHFARLGIGLFQ